jgi:type II secretion system protein G
MIKIISDGFTLVELLVVIAILAILSTLGVANFTNTRIKARDVSRKSDLQTISKSLEAYVNDHRSYPTSDSSGKIICQPSTNTICDWGDPFTDGVTTYAAALPEDPSNYDYYYVSNGTSYNLYTHLENTQDSSITTFNPPVYCGGSNLCNYKVNSSNVQ